MCARVVGHGHLDAGLTGACRTLNAQVTGPVVSSAMLLGILGRFEVFGDDGTPLDVGGPHSRTVGAALVAAGGRAVTSDALIESIWGDEPPASPAASLQTYVSRLRRHPPRGVTRVGVARLPVARRTRRGRRLALRGHRRPGSCRAPGRRPGDGSRLLGGGRSPVARPGAARGARARHLSRPGEPARGAPARGPRAPLRGRAAGGPSRAGGGGAGRGGDRPPVPRGAPGAAARSRCTAADARPRRSARSRVPGRRSRRSSGSTSAPSCAAWRSRSSITIRRSTLRRRRRRRLACGRSLARPAARPRPASAPALVGRRAELQVLESALADAREGHTTVVVEGAAGIGKTRLVAEFASDARQAGVPVAWGSCYEGSAAPSWWPWLDDPPVGCRRRAGNGLRRARPAAAPVGGREHRRVPRPAVRAARGGPPGAHRSDRRWTARGRARRSAVGRRGVARAPGAPHADARRGAGAPGRDAPRPRDRPERLGDERARRARSATGQQAGAPPRPRRSRRSRRSSARRPGRRCRSSWRRPSTPVPRATRSTPSSWRATSRNGASTRSSTWPVTPSPPAWPTSCGNGSTG